MHVSQEIVVMVLVFVACWGGLALAKASHQREEAEVEALGQINPASSRMAATTLRTQVRRDVHQRFKSRLAERGDPAIRRTAGGLWYSTPLGDFNHDERGDWPIARDANRQSQGVVSGNDAA